MNLPCNIIRDLLPLYAEELTSQESAAAVREHLNVCESCRSSYDQMKRQPTVAPEEPGLDWVRRELWKRRLLTAVCAVLVAGLLGSLFLSWLRSPIYLDVSVISQMRMDEEGVPWVTIDVSALGISTYQYEKEYIGGDTLYTAWTSRWMQLRWDWAEPRGPVESPTNARWGDVYYFTGQENILIYESPNKGIGHTGVQNLPRLVLSYYFLLALGAGAVLMVLALLLRKRRVGKWLGALGALGLSYALCQGIVCGFTFASFFVQQELFWGLVSGVCLWGVVLCLWAMRRRRP